jgi:nicotinate-nucleotide pyrophosphorylase (carboxylating)
MLKFRQVTKLSEEPVRRKILNSLKEDGFEEDITTQCVIPENMKTIAIIEAETPLIFVGADIIRVAFEECPYVFLFATDGDYIAPGQIIAKIEGNASYILRRERVMLNLIQRLSGIASAANQYSKLVRPYGVQILDTRKTVPGLRFFEKYAVHCGGASNHRYSLATNVLIKDNHLQAVGGVEGLIKQMKHNKDKYKIKQILQGELEVDNISQLKTALAGGFHNFLLDNMTPQQTAECVKLIRSKPKGDDMMVEASGGITLENVVEYAKTGVNAISIGALTHSVKAANIHLVFRKFERY